MTLDTFIAEHALPAAFHDTAVTHFLPLADFLAAGTTGTTRVVGINGAQGSGKSTLARLLALLLPARHGLRVATLSIDDIYLTRVEREALARDVHPLLQTRGVPGTHDVALGLDVLRRLRRLGAGEQLAVPRFDKASDDRAPRAQWPRVEGPVDIVLFEGWCVATPAQDDAELQLPINALEAREDADGRWRRYVNARLRTQYAELFREIDTLVLLRAPDFDCVYRWRQRQEDQLAARAGKAATRVMNQTQLQRFIQHYERLTRVNLQQLPALADVTLQLSPDQRIVDVNYRES